MGKELRRKVLGEQFRTFREKKGLSAYQVAKRGNLQIGQIKAIESGTSNYTIDVFLNYIHGCNLKVYFTENEEKEDNSSFDVPINQ